MTPSPTTRGRRALVAVVAVVVAVLLSGCLTTGQNKVWSELNADRRAHGRSSLYAHEQLTAKAQAWAQKMAREGRLSHSTLSAGVPSCWRSLAENVGYGPTASAVQDQFMASSSHRGNVLNPTWSRVGVGYATGGGRVWVVQVFMSGC